jgi:transposase
MLLTKSLNLSIYPNYNKLEHLRYTSHKFKDYTQIFCNKLFINTKRFLSTEGLGTLANQAQHKAIGVLSAQKAAAKATKSKTNVPEIKFQSCPAKIELSESKGFDYWVNFENQFKKNGRVEVPAKSHKRANTLLRAGWKLNNNCELVLQKNGKFQARVFLQKEVYKALPSTNIIGVDVGVRNSIVTSFGHFGKGLKPILVKAKNKNKERQRQKHKSKVVKTELKQVLDIEAKKLIARCCASKQSLVLEDPKVLANLKPRKSISNWAKTYFSERVTQLAQEHSVFVLLVHPRNTSITCSCCGHVSKESRKGRAFKCVSCGHATNADLNAALNLVMKGHPILTKILKKYEKYYSELLLKAKVG